MLALVTLLKCCVFSFQKKYDKHGFNLTIEPAVMDNNCCCNCEMPLPKDGAFVHCIECEELGLDVDLCVLCFRLGAECGPHLRGHNYQIIDPKGRSLFQSKSKRSWGWKEDLSLIRSALKHKLGNWEEIAADMDFHISANEAKDRFDRYFVRGSFGRYAACGTSWPVMDDGSEGRMYSQNCDTSETDRYALLQKAEFKDIVDFFNSWSGTVDFKDPDWFNAFKDNTSRIKDEISINDTTESERRCGTEEEHSSECVSTSEFVPPAHPLITVEFLKMDDHPTKRCVLSASDFDESGDDNVSCKEGGGNGENANNRYGRCKSARSSSKRASYMKTVIGLQSTDEEESENDERRKEKTVLRLKRIGHRWSKQITNASHLKDYKKDCLSISIDNESKQWLCKTYPEQFRANEPPIPLSHEERMKLKDDDLQMLAYMPERDDFELEYDNGAERMISRLLLSNTADDDEDARIEDAVKTIKLQKFFRTLKRRKAMKAAVREYELVEKFLSKEKNLTEREHEHIQEQFGQEQRIRTLMSKTCQVASPSELKELLEAVSGYSNLIERELCLKDMKSNGVKHLKGYGAVSDKAVLS